MSLELSEDTVPHRLTVKTFGPPVDANVVHLGQYEITLDDFLATAFYVLTNTDLVGDSDPRLEFVATVQTSGDPRMAAGQEAVERDFPDPLGEHVYLSTACRHQQHDQCRKVCKFCDAPCVCGHHLADERR